MIMSRIMRHFVAFLFLTWLSLIHKTTEEGVNNTTGEDMDWNATNLNASSCYCSILINEINTDSPLPPPSLFIELQRVYTSRTGPKPSNFLVDQYIVLLRASPLAVTFYADLSKEQLHLRNNAEVFVVGDPGLPELDESGISLNNPAIQSVYKNKDQPRLLPKGDESPYAILLLHAKDRRRDVNWMQLDQDQQGNFIERKFDVSLFSRFKDLIKDMLVFGRKVHASSCTVFDILWPASFEQQPGKTYVLRDWDSIGRQDYSLNRCSSTRLAFQIESFQYDKPSPGRQNPCNGVAFFLENVIEKVAPLKVDDEGDVEMCSADYAEVPASRYAHVDPVALANLKKEMSQAECKDCDTGTTSEVDDAMSIAINNGDIVSRGGTEVKLKLDVQIPFDPNMVNLATPYLPDEGELIRRKDIQEWLRVTDTGDYQRPVKFQCSACIERYGDKKVDVNLREQITTKDGYFNADKSANAKKIRRHATLQPHKDAVDFSYKYAKAKSDRERIAAVEEYEKKYEKNLKATVHMAKTIHSEAIAEVPFMYHPVFVDLEKSNGVPMGFHHYHEKAAKQMTMIISGEMHKILLEHLVKNNLPFSLITDATTSSRNVPFLILYFQLTEDGYPVTYYYRNVDLPEGETAKASFKAFWDAVLKDGELVPGFVEYVRSKLTFFVSDNAAVMVGHKESFLTHLQKELKREIVNIGCMAHKSSLALKEALRDSQQQRLQFIKKFESSLNDLYVFYMSRGSKRLQHLYITAKEFGVHLKRYRKNIEVRWAAGEYNCINAIVHNMKAVRDDLLDIQAKPGFTESAKFQAQALFTLMTDRPTVLLYYEFQDFLKINKLLSETFQERAGLLIDHYSIVTRAMKNYENLAISPGDSLKTFLKTCECETVCQIPTCTLAQVDQCSTNMKCDNGVSMDYYVDKTFQFLSARPVIYANLITAMKKFFNFGLISALVVFDNREFKVPMDATKKMENFVFVCNYIKFATTDCNQIGIYYFYLLEQFDELPLYTQNFQQKPSMFWPMVIQDTTNTLDIPPKLREFLQVLLILSDSSAEAERGFSVLTRLDSHARSSMNPDTIDALLRIKLNGNKPSSKIDAYRYAKKFAEKHHRVDDPKAGGTQKEIYQDTFQKRVSRLF